MIDKRETAAFRDQQQDAMMSVSDTMECADERCTTRAEWDTIKTGDDWQVSNEPNVPLLCPDCANRTPEKTLTPSQAREKYNQRITAYMGGDDGE